jgi:fucose permease
MGFAVRMIQNRAVITGPTFVSLGLMGAFFACWGTTLPALRSFLQIDIEKAAMLTAYGQASHAVTCLLGGILSDLFRRDKVLMVGCFVLGSGVILLGSFTSFPSNVLLVLWMGIGSGFILSSSNALLVGLYPDRKGPIMNFHHGVFGVGSFLSPLVMGKLLSYENRWPYGYDGLGVLLFAVSVFFLLTRVPSIPSQAVRRFSGDLRKLLRNLRFIHLIMMGFLAVGTQFALMFLSVNFLVEVKGLTIFEASAVLSSFFLCLLLGRLVSGSLALRIFNAHIIMLLLCFQVTSLFAVWKGWGWVSAAALTASGLACSAIFPCLLALTGTLFSEVAGTSLGILATMNSLGGMTIIWICGLLSQRISLEFGFGVMVFSSLAAVLLFAGNYRNLVGEERKCLSLRAAP